MKILEKKLSNLTSSRGQTVQLSLIRQTSRDSPIH